MDTGAVDAYDHGRHRFMSQPCFVGRPGADAEDDGWLLSLTHDAGVGGAVIEVVCSLCIAQTPT